VSPTAGKECPRPAAPFAGSTSLRWWTRSQRIRTEGEVPFEVALSDLQMPPVYQRIAEEAFRLTQLGMNPNRIAGHLCVDRTTIMRSLYWRIATSVHRP